MHRRSSTQTQQHDNDDDENVDEHVKEVAQCVLAAHARKGGLKNAEVKKVLKDAVHISDKQMRDVLGCQLTKDGDRLTISYVKKMPQATQGSVDIMAEAKQGLLVTVLSFIHMTKNPIVKTDKVKEFALWEFLEMLEVRQTTVHPVFGLPSKIIGPSNAAEFVAQGWLSFEKKQCDDRGDAEEVFYDWGPRAYAVIDPREILEVFCDIIGEKPEDWKEHYKLEKRKNDGQSPAPKTGRSQKSQRK